MKRAKHFLAVTLIFLVASVQCTLASSSLSSFLYYNKYEVFKTISYFAHPGNDFQYATYYVDGNYIYATIYSTGKFSGWDYTLDLVIHKSGKFDYLEVISDTDIAPAFLVSNLIKSYLDRLFEDRHSEFLSYVERLYGQRLYDMYAEDMCLAYLSFKYYLN